MGAYDHVASHNYYAPFGRMIGIADSDYSALGERMRQGYRTHISDFWKALNGWLEDHEGSLGLPTARSHGHNRHIAPALGQALVREADRSCLPDFFSYFRLRPGQEVEPERMLGLLDRWVPTGTLSSKVKDPWQTNEALRTALADVACAELLSWDGTPAHGELGKRLDVRLAVISRRRTGDRLVLHVTGSERQPPDRLLVGSAQRTAAWTRIGDESWIDSTLAPEDLLAEPVVVGGTRDSRRTPRKVNVFAREGGLWLESSNIEPGEPHVVVVDSNLQTARSLIETRARDGLAQGEAGDDWTVYKGVVIDSPLDALELPPLLQPLGTVARRSLALVGGLRLPNRPPRWHLHSPPVVSVADPPAGEYEVSIHGHMPLILGRFTGPCEIDLREVDLLEPGRHTVVAGDSEATLILEDVRRRGSPSPRPSFASTRAINQPRPRDAGCPTLGGYSPRRSASQADEHFAHGATYRCPMERRPPTRADDSINLGIGQRDGRTVRPSRSHPPCTAGGPCLLYIPYGVRKLRHEPPCVYCGLRPGERERFTAIVEAMLAADSDRSAPRRGVEGPTVDVVVDGILHARGGKVADLHEWLGHCGLDALTRYELLRDLVSLGTIDVGVDRSDGQLWRHLPLTLISHANDETRWLATGLVTPSAVDALDMAASELGGEVVRRAARDDEESMTLVEIRASQRPHWPTSTGSSTSMLNRTEAGVSLAVYGHYGGPSQRSARPRFRPPPSVSASTRQRPPLVPRAASTKTASTGSSSAIAGGTGGSRTTSDQLCRTVMRAELLAAAQVGQDLLAYVGGAIVLPLGCRLPGLYSGPSSCRPSASR